MILEEESSEKKEMRMKIGNPKKGKTDMEKLLRLSSEERDFYKQMGSAGAPQYNRGQNPSSQMSQISGSAMPIHAITADPDDPELQIFESGVEEVDRYFKEVRWFNRAKGVPSLQTYKFLDPEGRMVGYGAVGRRNTEVPDGSGQKY